MVDVMHVHTYTTSTTGAAYARTPFLLTELDLCEGCNQQGKETGTNMQCQWCLTHCTAGHVALGSIAALPWVDACMI